MNKSDTYIHSLYKFLESVILHIATPEKKNFKLLTQNVTLNKFS